ncbi:MAG: energy transducer TonB [Kofleriaceae bacterium]
MPIAAFRGRRVRPDWTWLAVIAAILIHVALALLVNAAALRGDLGGFGQSRSAAGQDAAIVPLQTGCISDGGFAAIGRGALCFAPWIGDTDDCLGDAQMSFWLDTSSCFAQKEKNVAEVSMLDKRSADQLTPIDPEPLLEQFKQQPPPPKPLAVPPPQPQNQPPPPPAPPAPPKVHPMQVVETAKPSQEKAPDNARFLAEYDTNVEKQTVARGSAKEPIAAKSKPEALQAKVNPKEASVQAHTDRPAAPNPNKAPDVPGSLAMRTPGPQQPSQDQQDAKVRGSSVGAGGSLAFDGYVPRKGNGAIEQQQHERSELPRGQSGAGGGAPDTPNLNPSQDVLERALGGGNVDHLDDVDNGDETALSAKRWIYASFFNRMKRQVAQNWDPATVWRSSDPTGQVYGFKTRITEVRVSLSATGALSKIIVTAPCGVGDLDDEAVRAFKSAAPFPNPPKGLAGSDGQITFAFSFFFEIGQSHTSWRLPGS